MATVAMKAEPVEVSSNSESDGSFEKVPALRKDASKKTKGSDNDDVDYDKLQLQDIVGEIKWPNGKKYYYARLRTEEIQKVCSIPSEH